MIETADHIEKGSYTGPNPNPNPNPSHVTLAPLMWPLTEGAVYHGVSGQFNISSVSPTRVSPRGWSKDRALAKLQALRRDSPCYHLLLEILKS